MAKRPNLGIYGLEEGAKVRNSTRNLFNETYNPKFTNSGKKTKIQMQEPFRSLV